MVSWERKSHTILEMQGSSRIQLSVTVTKTDHIGHVWNDPGTNQLEQPINLLQVINLRN